MATVGRSLLCVLALSIAPAWSHAATVEGESVRFTWSPAAGPVSSYGVFVTRNGSESPTPVQFVEEPSVVVGGAVGDQVTIRTAAFDAVGGQGPFSLPSELVLFVASPPPFEEPNEDPPPTVRRPAAMRFHRGG